MSSNTNRDLSLIAGISPLTNLGEDGVLSLAQTERLAIEKALLHCQGNIKQAAKLLDVAPSTIYRKKNSWQQE